MPDNVSIHYRDDLRLVLQEWAIAVLQSMKGSHEGVDELWQALHSTPSSQVLAVCQATLGNSPGVSAFVRELWR